MPADREALIADAPSRVVFDTSEIEEGDFVAYPGLGRQAGQKARAPMRDERDPRDWLEVRRIENRHVVGVRVNPQDWEIEVEYHVYPVQLVENGVELVKSNG